MALTLIAVRHCVGQAGRSLQPGEGDICTLRHTSANCVKQLLALEATNGVLEQRPVAEINIEIEVEVG